MTHLWLLRHNGVVIACAPSRPITIGHATFDDGADRALSQAWNEMDTHPLRRMMDADPSAIRYEHAGYTLALEPHPEPGEGS